MRTKILEVKRAFLQEESENLAQEGLRTLVLTQKYISEEDFKNWEKVYKAAETVLIDREAKLNQAVEKLEVNMELLAITGVEDKL